MVRIESEQPRKQRKARYQAPSHVKSKYLSAPLSAALKEKYKKKTLRVIKGDTVKVTRGDFVGNEGLVDAVDTKKSKLLSMVFPPRKLMEPKFPGISMHQMCSSPN